jgi:hypothetical protein
MLVAPVKHLSSLPAADGQRSYLKAWPQHTGINIVPYGFDISDRIGGRTLTVAVKTSNLQADKFDLGGQWVSSSQLHILQLLQELNLTTYPQYDAGYKVGQGSAPVFEMYNTSFPYFGSYYSCYELGQFISKVSLWMYPYIILTSFVPLLFM